MPKKPVRYDKLKSIKSVARKRVGSPPASRPLLERPLREKPKYKKSLLDLPE